MLPPKHIFFFIDIYNCNSNTSNILCLLNKINFRALMQEQALSPRIVCRQGFQVVVVFDLKCLRHR